ncbi:MAG: hypothetical protein MZV64_11440 [Ignavibacteriales bacterium]|nr:hypothetical protein [Ignavibacteriales bacterium]
MAMGAIFPPVKVAATPGRGLPSVSRIVILMLPNSWAKVKTPARTNRHKNHIAFFNCPPLIPISPENLHLSGTDTHAISRNSGCA